MNSDTIVSSINQSLEEFDSAARNVYFIERTRKHKINEKFDITHSEALNEFQNNMSSDSKEILESVCDSINQRKKIRSFYDDLGPEQIGYLPRNNSDLLKSVIDSIYKKEFTELKSFKAREKFHSYGYHFTFDDESNDIMIFSYVAPNNMLKRKKKFGMVFQNGLVTITDEILVVEKKIDCVYLKRHDCFLVKNRKRFENIFGLNEFNVKQTQKQLNSFKKNKRILISPEIEKEILNDPQLTSKIARMARNKQFDKPIKYYEQIKSKIDEVRLHAEIDPNVCDMVIEDNSIKGDSLCRVHTFVAASNRDFVKDLTDDDLIFKVLGGKEKITK